MYANSCQLSLINTKHNNKKINCNSKSNYNKKDLVELFVYGQNIQKISKYLYKANISDVRLTKPIWAITRFPFFNFSLKRIDNIKLF